MHRKVAFLYIFPGQIYKGKFLKIQSRFSYFSFSIFWHENDFLSWFNGRGRIAEVLTVFYTPILAHIINVKRHTSLLTYKIICHWCHMSAMTYDIWQLCPSHRLSVHENDILGFLLLLSFLIQWTKHSQIWHEDYSAIWAYFI